MASDVWGKALLDYQHGKYTEDIKTFSSLDEDDVIPLPYLFRVFDEMPVLEQKALKLCRGNVLDIGAGSGSHSLYLQEKGLEVTALDASKGAIATCRLRGVENIRHTTIEAFEGEKFDTLLLLMNGIGLAGSITHLGDFLSGLTKLLQPSGQILVDSSDIIYMFEDEENSGKGYNASLDTFENYYGEVEFTMSYKGEQSAPFSWLYADFDTLSRIAQGQNLACELICEGEHYDYLARLEVLQH
ncbi:methyltransferase domain-containing protein [Aggregatimonas sangjinii]|uniref:Methyltransferase domain-containing protein n=1 Tax=Aggregatimonas sangjinii TaxID=2583587 RepID=A0A5B7SV24_9FLAO|nr:methyltransferase domain-containing protein [Aggregatimonas sangjinii]QCX01003.1 methyltransferase domain-containing protein [Aggregatimonas sangjinii]